MCDKRIKDLWEKILWQQFLKKLRNSEIYISVLISDIHSLVRLLADVMRIGMLGIKSNGERKISTVAELCYGVSAE